MARLRTLLLVLLLGLASAALAQTPKRAALIIANSNYPGPNRLANPPRDAALVRKSLQTAGFEVITVAPDLGHDAFFHALREFRQQSKGAEVAFIYYAGHALQSNGRNWLIPIDAQLEEENDLILQALDLDAILSAVDGAKWRVVALDACRDNPFGLQWHGRSRAYQAGGLSPVQTDNVLVIYAAAENHTAADGHDGQDSPFAAALARRLPQDGLPIQMLGGQIRDDVLNATKGRQRPFVSASISGEPFYLGAAPAPLPPKVAEADAAELAFWNSIATGNDIKQYDLYLSHYPNGQFSEIALQKRQELAAPEARAAIAEISPRRWELDDTNSIFASVLEKTTLVELLRLADAGDAHAEQLLGYARAVGAGGLERDFAEALRWSRQAAQHGDSRAAVDVGLLFEKGEGVAVDLSEAMRWFRKAAEAGNVIGQYDVGVMFERGTGVAQDYAEAMRWYRKAAEQQDPYGWAAIGHLYELGHGVPQDYDEAHRWYQKAADQGNTLGQNYLAGLYRSGHGVAQDPGQAAFWYRKAAEQGDSAALVRLGLMYQRGDGMPKDYVQAMRLYRHAADQDSPAGEINVGGLYEHGFGVSVDLGEALHWYRKAAEQGVAAAQLDVGEIYLKGLNGSPDYAEAMRWLNKAAEQGEAFAQREIGELYANGEGVARNPQAAKAWMQKAANQGDRIARDWLAKTS